MTESEFFPPEFLQTIIDDTGGVLVEFRGQEAKFHFESPSFEDALLLAVFGNIQGFAKVLIGDAHAYPDLTHDELITVAGVDYLIADWKTPGDGGVIYIALKSTTRV